MYAIRSYYGYPPQATKAGDERRLKRCFGSLRFAASGQVPTQQFPGMAVDYQGQRAPAITASPDPAQVSSPALIGRLRHRGQGLNPRPEAYRTFAYLPALKLEDAQYRVLVEAQQSYNFV